MSIIHFVGGEKGGVGKSVVARLLAQFFIDRQLPFVALDADGSHGSLLRHYAEYARPVDLGQFESADEILALATETERRVLVDLPAQSDRPLSTWITEAGVLELARESSVEVVFWHVMDDGKDAVFTLDRLLSRYGTAARYHVVKNLGRGKDFTLFDVPPPTRWRSNRVRPSWNCPNCTAPRCRISIASMPVSGPRSTTTPWARARLHAWIASASRSG